ncbi:MAG: hypothetical protein AAFY81_03105 [Pseudomonadota bacterium]
MPSTIPFKEEWLLPLTKALIAIARFIFIFAGTGLAAALLFTIIGKPDAFGSLGEMFVEAGLSYDGRIGMGIVFAVSLGSVFMIERFLKTLKDVIDTVPGEDPFIPANADRLQTMAILAVSMQSNGLLSTSFSEDVAKLARELGLIIEPSIEGALFALVLFILARVFRQGSAMREDLEGTV